ncbi:ABC-F family ATP-binding cassette domain-containing protein [bacterium]|nr:ABC-F family ATP-binding cassette domain-containing protein [bacterium]
MLKAENIRHDFGARPLFDGLELVIEEGARLGLVGANGSGKTTLFRILAGQLNPLEGSVIYPKKVRVGYLAQEPEFVPGATVFGALEEGLAEVTALQDEFSEVTAALQTETDHTRRAALSARQQELHDRLQIGGGWDIAPRIEEMITVLGLPAPETRLDHQSGGTLKRVALARVLLSRPEMLFLDEPTNHLDTRTVEWLERRLAEFRGTLVLITHDRYFLEAVVNRIAEISLGKIKQYPGSYSAFLEAKKKEWELIQRLDERREKILAREIEWLRRGPKARSTKQKARVDRAKSMARVRRTEKDKPVELLFDPESRTGRTILKAHRVGMSFDSRPVVSDFSLELLGGERIGVLGPNGCGKTTLIRMLVGELEPESGYVKEGLNTSIAYFDQKRAQLDPAATIWDSVAPGGEHVLVSSQRLHKKAFLESFLFPAPMQRLKVGLLSGGEKNRLLLARLMLAGANVLVLDEPTNDLDLPTLEVLEQQLVSFKGSLIVVTHDRWFLDRVVEEIYAFEGGGVIRHYPGNYSYYLETKAAEREAERAAQERLRAAQRAETPAAPRRQGLHYLEKKELETIEERISSAEAELTAARARLEDPSVASDPAALAGLYEAVRAGERTVAALYGRWEELEAKQSGGE